MSEPGEVSESVLLHEPVSGAKREVDILLVKKFAGETVRMGIECRGRKDRDDVEWIDNLVGKYKHLPVDKVVAVSKSGFSDAARRKAEAERISALTLREAMVADWPSLMCKVGVCGLIRNETISHVGVKCDPPLPAPLDLATEVQNEHLERVGTVAELAWNCLDRRRDAITADLSARMGELFPTVDSFNSRVVTVEFSDFPASSLWIVAPEQQRHRLVYMRLRVDMKFATVPATSMRHVLGAAYVTTAVLTPSTGSVSVMIVQETDSPDKIKLSFGPVDSSDLK